MKKLLIVMVAAILLIGISGSARAYELYFGDLHSHTSFSDGEGLPEEAFNFARNKAGVDYWSVTDHVEQLLQRNDLPEKTSLDAEWNEIKRAARVTNEDGKFVAIAGFEWAMDPTQGHINVINTDKYTRFGETYKLKKFYRWVYKHPKALIGFNHPSSNSEDMLVFDHFKLVPPIASQTIYVATNKPEDLEYYYMALDNGWRVGPSAQQDNHSKNWGMHPKGNFTAVYAEELTYNGIIESLRARRFYATKERKLRLWFAGNGQAMGSVVKANEVDLEIKVNHDGGEKTSSVKLITNGGEEVQNWTPEQADFETTVNIPVDFDGTRWYLILAELADGKFSISAPIWIEKKQES